MWFLVWVSLKSGQIGSLGNGVQGGSLRFHSDVGIVLQHFPADVSGDGHDGLLTSLTFGQFGDAGMPQIVKPEIGWAAALRALRQAVRQDLIGREWSTFL